MTRLRPIDTVLLVLMTILLVWWRAHTFAPTIESNYGWKLWPEMSGATEPLDCDEAAYGYMGRRMADGAVLYRDVTEYKPPGGYWFYALVVKAFGATEMTIRLMMIPVVIATLGLIGSIARKISGRIAAIASMAVFVLMSTDPYVFGNGSNLEHLMNLALTAALWAFLKAFETESKESEADDSKSEIQSSLRIAWLLASGLCIGLAATVKQVALIGLVPIVFESIRSNSNSRRKWIGIAATIFGFLIPCVAAIVILAAQGALADARADVIDYSRVLATDTPADEKAPSFIWRWLTGNSDPRNGALPWPFGKTDWLVWWGTGTWPLHVAAAMSFVIGLSFRSIRSSPAMRIVLWQYPIAWGMIILPGLYWQHYYMLLVPVTSILAGAGVGYATKPRNQPFVLSAAGIVFGLAIVLTTRIQWLDYFEVPAESLTSKYKGGAQWISLRNLGEDIRRRTVDWEPRPILEVWGWQSPLLFYSGLDAPDRYFFTDPLAKANIGKDHPSVRPRIDALTANLKSKRPELIFCGDIPFAELKSMLDRDYIASSLVGSTPDGRGLFVRKDKYQAFHARRPDDKSE